MSDGRSFQQERITDLWSEMTPLATAHQAEAGTHFPLKLNEDAYLAAQQNGSHLFHTARLNGQLVGYCSTLLSYSNHDGKLQAHEDGIYILPEHRGWMGRDLEHYVDRVLMDAGCARSYRERIIDPDHVDRSTRRGPLGYKPMSILWVRDLVALKAEVA